MEQVRISAKRLYVILGAKDEKTELNKAMKNKFQHLTKTQRNELLKLLQKIEELFDVKNGTWKTYPLDFE